MYENLCHINNHIDRLVINEIFDVMSYIPLLLVLTLRYSFQEMSYYDHILIAKNEQFYEIKIEKIFIYLGLQKNQSSKESDSKTLKISIRLKYLK